MIDSRGDKSSNPSTDEKYWWVILLAAAASNCALQIGWFWRFRSHNITMDGIAYIGLARHLVDGDLKASLHGYWSPLTSWIIAATTIFSSEFTLLGRLVTIGSFLLCLPLVYILTFKLWRSRVAAAFAVFWFAAARGVVALAVGMILADFVLTACVLLYFVVLLEALHGNSPRFWGWLGVAHAMAFLAKAICMPWLAISSATALVACNARSPRRLAALGLLAFLAPGVVWLSWGSALRWKYGVFTTGYQLRANLITDWTRHVSHRPRGDSLAYVDAPTLYDKYMVGESWTAVRDFRIGYGRLLPVLLSNEIRNVPSALKELLILLTPAGVAAFPAMLMLLFNYRSQYYVETIFVCVVLLSAITLVGAYCMLVFDTRYVIPVMPLMIAICSPLLLPSHLTPDAPKVHAAFQRIGLAVLVASMIFLLFYRSSPLRTVDRDFEASCYQAAGILRGAAPEGRLVSVGNGPYPEHGVGFEAGIYVAYLSGWRIVGSNSELPHGSALDGLATAVLASGADAVAVWGTPGDASYVNIVSKIRQAPNMSSATPFSDPHKGEVGTLFLFGVPR